MAIMFPNQFPEHSDKPVSSAEKRLYKTFKEQLSQEWYVFHGREYVGLKAPEHRSPSDGDIDFILVHPSFGLLVLEVKGGQIFYDSSKVGGPCSGWYSVDRNKDLHHIKDPFSQASQNLYALLKLLQDGNLVSERTCFHAVAFPDDEDLCKIPLPPTYRRELIIDRTDMDNLELKVRSIFKFWGRDKPLPNALGQRLIDFLQESLSPPPPPPALKIQSLERMIAELSADQGNKLRTLGTATRALINGGPGTGKTILAVTKAAELANQGKKVLLTCYNEPLRDYLRSTFQGSEDSPGEPGLLNNVTIQNFHGLCITLATKAGIAIPELPPQDNRDERNIYFQEMLPNLLNQALDTCPEHTFDAIIVDEGQDFSVQWLTHLLLCLKDPDKGLFYFFYDNNQILQKPTDQHMSERLRNELSIQTELTLYENFRNTRDIFDFIQQFYRGDVAMESKGPGGMGFRPAKIEYSSEDEMFDKLNSCLQNMLGTTLYRNHRLTGSDIAILTPRSVLKSGLTKFKPSGKYKLELMLAESTTTSPHTLDPQTIPVWSIQRFKGLEAPIVIVIELDEVFLEKYKNKEELCYIAASRARCHLIVMGMRRVLEFVTF